MAESVMIPGKSGAEYKFKHYSMDYDFTKNSVVYIFAAHETFSIPGFFSVHTYKLIYIGESVHCASKKNIVKDKEKKIERARHNGANCLLVLNIPSWEFIAERQARQIKDDLLAGNDTLCDIQDN